MPRPRKSRIPPTPSSDSPTPAAAESPSSSNRNYAAIGTQYARDIVSGNIPACKQVRQACQRHLRDLDRSEAGDFDFVYDAASAARACEFIEALPHVKGEWAARRELLRLANFQVFIVASLFGWVERARPTRYRFRDAYICIPRKNAKTTLCAAIALYKFAADNEYCAEVYIGATSEKQAKRTAFKMIRFMALKTPQMCAAFGIKVNTHSLVKVEDGSILQPVIATPGDGDSPSCATCEEFHEHRTPELRDTMKTGMIARENPLMMYVTTAGVNRSGPCYLLQVDVEKVLAGTIINERMFGIIYTIDAGDNWASPDVLQKANPLWEQIDQEELLNEQRQAVQSARLQNTFKTKHLNIWCNAAIAWMNMETWDALADPTLRLEDFENDDCYDALDLARRVDLASKVRAFRRYLEDSTGHEKAHYYVFGTHYQNRAQVEDPTNAHFAKWELEGRLVVTPGNTTDFNYIADDLVEDVRRFRVLRIPHDPTHAPALVQFVQARDEWDQTVEFVEVTQNRQNYSPAMKEVEALVLEGRIHHDGDPVLAWALSNVVALALSRDDVFPTKEGNDNKIDPAVAMIMAIGQWVLTGDESSVGLDFLEGDHSASDIGDDGYDF